VRIATYNVNGVNGRLPNLLAWLKEAAPDVVCLQELKAPDEKFPADAIRAAGYRAIWHGQKSWNGVAILQRGAEPVEVRRGLPGDPDDTHSRYIEAAIDGMIVGCLYLPNGNPGAEIRLQAALVCAPGGACQAPAGERRPCRARWRLQRHAYRSRRL
jgi:exodeoxyribonuclease-3